jgi:hypothetical protein
MGNRSVLEPIAQRSDPLLGENKILRCKGEGPIDRFTSIVIIGRASQNEQFELRGESVFRREN